MRQALLTVQDPEAHRRLEVLIQKLHTEQLITPRCVTLTLDKAPLMEVLAAIARQTSYKINAHLDEEQEKIRLSINWKGRPFWEAIDEVCSTAGLSVNLDGEDEIGLTIYNSDSYNPHVWYNGPFRFVATNISSHRNIQLAGLPRKFAQPRQPEYLSLTLQISSEPKNPIVSTHQPVLTKAMDDTGANLLPPDEDQHRYYYSPYMFRGFNQYVGLNLARGERNGNLIKELHGKVTVLLLSDTRPEVVVENIGSVNKKKFIGRSTELEIDSVSEGASGLTVTLTARQLNPKPDDYAWANTVYQRLELWDDAGLKWVGNLTGDNANISPGLASLTLSFTAPVGNKPAGKPSRLQFVEWLTHPREVEFVFKDIPLP
jgi:hypothetical protein